MERLDVNDFSIDQVLAMVESNSVVQQAIGDAAKDSPEQPWSLIDIQDNLHDALNLELDFDDTETCGALLTYYNESQESLAVSV